MKTIAVDVDDVLAAFADEFINFSNDKWSTRLTVDDFDEHWAKAWKVDFEEEKKRITTLFESGIFKTARPHTKADHVLRQLAEGYKLVVLTAREKTLKQDTFDWLNHHFKDVFAEIHFSGQWDDYRTHGKAPLHLTKAQKARDIGADYLIDDLAKHCIGAAEVGIECLLFGNYPWNQVKKLPEGVTRVKNWPEVLEYFNAKG